MIAKKDAGTTNRSMFARETKADVLKETEPTNSRIVLNAISEQLIDQFFSSFVNLSAKSEKIMVPQPLSFFSGTYLKFLLVLYCTTVLNHQEDIIQTHNSFRL